MKKISVSAPGKLVVFGEHAVVHGYPCIVTAVNQRIEVTASFNGRNELVINAPQLGIKNYHRSVKELSSRETTKEVCFIEAVVKRFYKQYGLEKGLIISTRSQFSHTYGFGSSSGITIATIKALSLLYKVKLSDKQIFNLGYQAVLDIQGVGSGFDLAAALWGRTIYFLRAAKKVEQLNVEIPIIVCYSGVKADTPTLVRQVGELKRKNPLKINNIFREIRIIVDKAKIAIIKRDWETVGQLMDENQKLLIQLNISNQKLEKLIQTAKNAGAWGAKISGAGGGDNIIILAHKNKRVKIVSALEQAGGKVIKVNLNSQGVICH